MPAPVPPFPFPALLPQSWYIGHMHRALGEITRLVQAHSLDLIIETRDARLPLTSLNPAFDRLLAHHAGRTPSHSAALGPDRTPFAPTRRLIVYNKADLAQDCFHQPLARALARHSDDPVVFTDSRDDAQVRRLLRVALRMAKRPLEGPDDKITLLVAGMPNVGKSSLLNALRRVGVHKGKAASTSSEPGHTRRLSTVIKIATSPPVYVYDTPGIMVPFLGRGVAGQEAALKLALTGGIKQSLFEREVLAEYLLWRLRVRGEMRDGGWRDADLLDRLALPASTSLADPTAFFTALAHRLSAVQRGGHPDLDFAGRWLVQAFREGKLGRWTLDGLGRGGEAVDDVVVVDPEPRPGPGLGSGRGGGMSKGKEGAKEVTPNSSSGWLQRTERRWGYLSREEEDEDIAPPTPPPPATDEKSDATPKTPTPSTASSDPLPSSSSSSPPSSDLDPPVELAVTTHHAYLARLGATPDLQSSHQTKKATKADQARVRELKRRGHEVAKPAPPPARSAAAAAMRRGGQRGGSSGAARGPARGPPPPARKLVSARRRKFRRSG